MKRACFAMQANRKPLAERARKKEEARENCPPAPEDESEIEPYDPETNPAMVLEPRQASAYMSATPARRGANTHGALPPAFRDG